MYSQHLRTSSLVLSSLLSSPRHLFFSPVHLSSHSFSSLPLSVPSTFLIVSLCLSSRHPFLFSLSLPLLKREGAEEQRMSRTQAGNVIPQQRRPYLPGKRCLCRLWPSLLHPLSAHDLHTCRLHSGIRLDRPSV